MTWERFTVGLMAILCWLVVGLCFWRVYVLDKPAQRPGSSVEFKPQDHEQSR
jgi:hypothetical protein